MNARRTHDVTYVHRGFTRVFSREMRRRLVCKRCARVGVQKIARDQDDELDYFSALCHSYMNSLSRMHLVSIAE